jgi:SAM-dependent methyltransferase
MAGEPSAAYTKADHAFRAADPYAGAKYRLTLRWLMPFLSGDALLYNIGMGGGHFNALLASASAIRVVGCEPDPTAFEFARRSAPEGYELLPVGLGEFARGRAAANFVVMHDVLEHIEDDDAAARTLRGLVAPEGRVILSVPALMSLFGIHDEELGHFRRYTKASLRKVLERYFAIERLQWFGMASIPIAWYYSRVRRVPYPTAGTRSLLGAAYARVCEIEAHLPEPVGTSLIVQLRPRADVPASAYR